MDDMKIRILGWAGHITKMEDEVVTNRHSQREIPQHKISSKSKNKMGGRRPDGCITDPRNRRLGESDWG